MGEDINEFLVPARVMAAQTGNTFLVYLIEMAQIECLFGAPAPRHSRPAVYDICHNQARASRSLAPCEQPAL